LRQQLRRWFKGDEEACSSVFKGRPLLTDDEFYQRYFLNSKVQREVAIGVRRVFCEKVALDMRRLAPDDDFSRELSAVWTYDSLGDVEVVLEIERRFGISISEEEARESLTMGGLIHLVDLKVKGRGGNLRGGA